MRHSCQHIFGLRSQLTLSRLIDVVKLSTFQIFTILLAVNAHATSGDVVVVPLSRTAKPVYSTQSGLQIQVDTTWVGNRGYRPIRVTVRSAKTSTADIPITINFYAGSWRSGDRAIEVEHDFKLAQGTSSVTTRFSIPQFIDWNTFGWEVWVDGAEDEELSLLASGFNSGNAGATAAGIFDLKRSVARNSTQLLQAASGNAAEEKLLDMSSLPSQWIDYSGMDLFITSVDSLELVQVSSQEKLAALLRWVRAGGNMWVTDIGFDYKEMPRLDKIVGSHSADKLAEVADSKDKLRHWQFLMLGDTGRTRLNTLTKLTMQLSESETELTATQQNDIQDPSLAVDSRQWFVARAYGLGTIVAIKEAGGDAGIQRRRSKNDTATALQRSSLAENLQWATRHGNDPATGNSQFNHLLIEEVGAAPVFEFQLLISLFVIAIGPVNYWLLKRRNQLPMLLLTVPAAALLATMALFTYGFLADGIGARVRVRSLTMLDQNVGEVASWARLSYYAGIAPADGLQMPSDTTLYPILPASARNSNFRRRHANQQRSLEWDGHQFLTRGWLGSRTPTQYLALTARPTEKKLMFEKSGELLRVTNNLGTKVLALIVQDHEGNIYECEASEASATVDLSLSNYVKATSLFRRYLTENIPEVPAGFMESNRSRRNSYGSSIADSLMELQLEASGSPNAVAWKNGTYLAITATGIEVPLGLEEVAETSSFHVVRGTW